MPSFDVVSKVDMQEVDNAINQVKKEIDTRYDFKGTKCEIKLEKDTITLHASDKMKLQAMTEILNQKMVKRGIGVRSLDYKDVEDASLGSLRQKVEIKQGISQEDGKKITKLIKELNMKKVSAQIQGDQVRVNGPKRDDLQTAIAALKSGIELELQFVNFKD
ncbi:MAG: YajQ family cyclic di-GMP-binding protein [Proteobacteria bacterium]|nr:YajQ family cyclic di-GMP-binding protein [Pseudomonadota bacterium]